MSVRQPLGARKRESVVEPVGNDRPPRDADVGTGTLQSPTKLDVLSREEAFVETVLEPNFV